MFHSLFNKILKALSYYFELYSKLLFNFTLFNLGNLYRKKIIFNGWPTFNQNTICAGKGLVEIGNGCTFGYKLGGFHKGGSIELQARYEKSRIKIGNYVATNNNIMFCAANYIEIGDHTLIGQNVTLFDHEAHGTNPDERNRIGKIGKIIIGKNVWIGNNVMVLKDTAIGNNSIVATGAVVTGNFPANVIIGGIPAKIIKSLND